MGKAAQFMPNYGVTLINQCNPNAAECVVNGSLDFVLAGNFFDVFGVENELWQHANLLVSLEAGLGKDLANGSLLGANFDYVGFYPEYFRRLEVALGYYRDDVDVKIGLVNPMRFLFPSNITGDEVNRFLGTALVRPLAWNWPVSPAIPMMGATYAFNRYFDLSGVVGFDAFAEDRAFMAGTRIAGHWQPGSDFAGTLAGLVNYRMGTSIDEVTGNYTPQGGTSVGLHLEQKFTPYAQLGFQFGYLFYVQDQSDQISFSSQFSSRFWEHPNPGLGMNLLAGLAHTYYQDDARDFKINTEELYLRFQFLEHYACTLNMQFEQRPHDNIFIPGLKFTAYY